MSDFQNEVTNLQSRVATFSEWRVGKNGQALLNEDKMRVALNCANHSVAYATLVGAMDYSFILRFDDGDMLDINAYDAWMRDLRPAYKAL